MLRVAAILAPVADVLATVSPVFTTIANVFETVPPILAWRLGRKCSGDWQQREDLSTKNSDEA